MSETSTTIPEVAGMPNDNWSGYLHAAPEPKISLSGGQGVYRFLQHEEEVQRDDLEINKATFRGLLNYIMARKDMLLERKGETHLRVNARAATMELHVREHGGSRHGGAAYDPATVVKAEAYLSDKFQKVKALMTNHGSPHDLFEKLREVPHLFNDAVEHRNALNTFRSQSISIKKMMKDVSNENGEREKAMKMEFEDSPVAVSWSWRVPIYEGEPETIIPCSTLYEVNSAINGVNLRLVNWELDDIVKKAVDEMVARTVTAVETNLGKDAIPVIYVDGK